MITSRAGERRSRIVARPVWRAGCSVVAALWLGGAAAGTADDIRRRPHASTDAKSRGCEWAGPGFTRMLGTDSCVRLGGSIRTEFGTSSTSTPFVPPSR